MKHLGINNRADDVSTRNTIKITSNITKNTDFAISATKKIVSVSVFNPSTGKMIYSQPALSSDRLTGNIRITQNISNAEITIITD